MSIFNEIYTIYTNHLSDFTKLKSSIPEHVYHYTSPNGLKSIIESKSIFISDYRFLNDITEIQYFINIVLDELEKSPTYKNTYFYTIIKSHLNNNFIDQFKMPIIYYNNDLKKTRVHNIDKCSYYIFSTSLKPDSLSMWNYYSKVPSNEGYNLKFDLSNLLDQIKFSTKDLINSYISKITKSNASVTGMEIINYGKVNYDISTQRNTALKILDSFYKISTKIPESTFNQDALQFLNHLIRLYAYYQKSQDFSVEDEYRTIIALPKSISSFKNIQIEFPVINGCFAPKLKIALNKWEKLIEEIKISPKNSTNFAKVGLRTFLDYNELEKVDITFSDIKVRF
ncbi:DUF2971 domain-containing protein [Clostridium sp. WILCCON 0269]|uniref:DUF2971 domain-containing protein n=1 Tax=Candidatus Clostridium eludens TaxID=3381663 RepID=A0ABW8SP70_9CLOT